MLHCVTASRFFAAERGAPASKDRGEARKLLPFYMHFSQPDVIFHDALPKYLPIPAEVGRLLG
jgi:hypothetical protein